MNKADKVFEKGVDAAMLGELMNIPFPGSALSLRPGSTSEFETKKWGKRRYGQVLVYFDKQKAQDQLDKRIGAHNWHFELKVEGITEKKAVVRGRLIIHTNAGDIVREDVGEGEVALREDGSAVGNPEITKSAATDAFRRCCASLGLGRYLYTKTKPIWHPVNKFGFLFGLKQDDVSGTKVDFGTQEAVLSELGYNTSEEEVDRMIETIFVGQRA